MTLEELKAEAKKHGYKLVKDLPYISMLPCVCGHKNIAYMCFWGAPNPFYHQCRKCGFKSQPTRTKYEAKIKWNECVEKVRERDDNT